MRRDVWQVSGGPADRPYADVFLRYGVALIGPYADSAPERGDSPTGPFRRFVEEMHMGDLLMLRTGSDAVAAIGIVAGPYEFLEPFDDVNGWDLRHGRRVRWSPLPEPFRFERQVFGANPRRFSRVQNDEAIDFAQRFLASGLTRWQEAPLPDLPPEEPPLETVPEPLRGVVGLARDLAGIYGDPEALGDPPAENEMVAHFVVPMLRALGWRPEQIGVEWRRVDVALFEGLPRTPESCRFLIEAKRLGSGLEGARQQALEYASKLGVTRDLVVTDGFRYRAFDCQRDFAPVAYANLAHLKRSSMELFARLRNN